MSQITLPAIVTVEVSMAFSKAQNNSHGCHLMALLYTSIKCENAITIKQYLVSLI